MSGPFIAHETIMVCVECGRAHSSDTLRKLVPAGCNVAYDVLVFTGRALFQCHRTVGETLGELAARGVRISASEVSHLGRRFILRLALAHREAVPGIRQAMELNGGYVLHVDATHEAEAPALMSGMDGLSEIVLANVKVPSESADNVSPFLERVKKDFGTPAACVHDMGLGVCKAVEDVFKGVPDFICHFHFLRDIGKDFMEKPYDTLRKRLRAHSASTRLHAFGREMARRLQGHAATPGILDKAVRTAAAPVKDETLMPAAAAYALAHWALQGKRAGDGYGFPFDRPLLDFAERLLELRRRLPDFKELLLTGDGRDNKPLRKLFHELSDAADDNELNLVVKDLRWRRRLFDQLRASMRIASPGGGDGLNDQGGKVGMSSIKQGVEAFRLRLDKEARLAADQPCRKMAEQIDKYAGKLFADPITVKGPGGTMTIHPQRTNNILEQFFRGVRRAHRRKTGDNSMNRALQTMLADTPLVRNLDNQRYLDILLDGKATLEELFAYLDAKHPSSKDEKQQSTGRILSGFTKLIRQRELPKLIASFFIKAAKNQKTN
jgi:hypothetical protein